MSGLYVVFAGWAGFIGSMVFASWASRQLDRNYFPWVWASWWVSLALCVAGQLVYAGATP